MGKVRWGDWWRGLWKKDGMGLDREGERGSRYALG
jgi:hypothetical protein